MALSALLVGGGYLIGEQQAEQAPVIQEQAVTPASNASADTNTVPAEDSGRHPPSTTARVGDRGLLGRNVG